MREYLGFCLDLRPIHNSNRQWKLQSCRLSCGKLLVYAHMQVK